MIEPPTLDQPAWRPIDQPVRDELRTRFDQTFFVEAGAGTGKTSELVHRIVGLVVNGHSRLSRIVAITFTTKAAAELRDRVRQQLEAWAADLTRTPEQRELAHQALGEVDSAAIETVHSFAQRILIGYPLEAGLPPGFQVMDAIQSNIAFEDRWRVFCDILFSDGNPDPHMDRAFQLGVTVSHLHGVAQEFQKHWDRLEELTVVRVPLRPIDAGPLIRALMDACEMAMHCANSADLLRAHIETTVAELADKLRGSKTDAELLGLLSDLPKLTCSRGQKGNWNGAVSLDDAKQRLVAVDDLAHQILSDIRVDSLSWVTSTIRDFILKYRGERATAGTLEFHDLLVMARDLLRDNPTVRRQAAGRVRYLFIDEFQDTDPLQVEIALLLTESDSSPASSEQSQFERITSGRIFFVGDPKQSIYRFRRADLALYHAMRDRFLAGRRAITQNFRSVRPVIDWVNSVFPALMEGVPNQAEYTELQSIVDGAQIGCTSVLVLGGPTEETIDARGVRMVESAEIAELISEIRHNGWLVRGDDPVVRPARFQDVAILLPSRTALVQLEEALEATSIPYSVESRSLLFSTQEVRDLLSILRAIDDPGDEVALVAALRSPAFACSDVDLFDYVQAGGEWSMLKPPPADIESSHPVAAAMTALLRYHNMRWWVSVNVLIERIVRERHMLELAFAHPRPRERWRRIRYILDQSRAWVENDRGSLSRFLEWADDQAESGTQVLETVVPEADDDAVRIMTVHASKGLEFPIVILGGLGAADVSSRGSQRVLWDAAGKPHLRLGAESNGFQSPEFRALDEEDQRLDENEKIRLLYVAATRARDHLIVSLHYKKKAKDNCAAARISPLCTGEFDRIHHPASVSGVEASPSNQTLPDSEQDLRLWRANHEETMKALSGRPSIAATAIASEMEGSFQDGVDEAGSFEFDGDDDSAQAPAWSRGGLGTSIGRAVHAVMQATHLSDPAGAEALVQAQAAAEGIADRAGDIDRLVNAFLRSDRVRQAALASGRCWREVYISAHIGDTQVEGFIDLLYETPDGLIVVDYKTDTVRSEGDVEAKSSRYRYQAAAYALALEKTLGRPVAECVLLFVVGRVPVEAKIDDLEGLKAAVVGLLERNR